MATTQVPFPCITLVRPSGSVQAGCLQDFGNHLLVCFDRPMEVADLQGKNTRFPWTAQSEAELVDAQGKPKIIHANRLVSYCRKHQICWLDREYSCCPRCDELDAP